MEDLSIFCFWRASIASSFGCSATRESDVSGQFLERGCELATDPPSIPSRLFSFSSSRVPTLNPSVSKFRNLPLANSPIPRCMEGLCWPFPPFPYLHLMGFMRCMPQVWHHLLGVCFFRELAIIASLSDFPTQHRNDSRRGVATDHFNRQSDNTTGSSSQIRHQRRCCCRHCDCHARWMRVGPRYFEETGQSALRSVPAEGQCFAD